MLNKRSLKNTSQAVIFVLLLFVANTLGQLHYRFPEGNAALFYITYMMSIGIYIGLFTSWTISIYNRIMQSHVRTFLMLIGANIILWVSIRSVKWGAFIQLTLGDRIAWYMFYIPMIMIPVCFLFTALCVGEDENYRLNKKWYLILIPAFSLMLLVLTNDFHMLVFSGIDLNIHMYGRDYTHNIGYFIVVIFLVALVLLSSVLIIKKFRHSATTRRASRLPLLVLAGVILYTTAYVAKPVYGIGYYFMDMTIFLCAASIAFWEACIRTGLIHSNSHYSDFFAMSTTRSQILNPQGEVVYISENALPMPKEHFDELKASKSTSFNSTTISHMAKIHGGYVAWNSDVSQLRKMIRELKSLGDKLYEEVDLLTLENEQKSESARLEKLKDLHSVLLTEALPYSERIKSEIITNGEAPLDTMKKVLFETGMTSTYIKRKVNLILTAQTEKCISTDEMHRAFLESFQLLRIYDRTCQINITDDYDMDLGVAMLCHDLYQKILERVGYEFDTIYINFRLKENSIVFSVEIAGDIAINTAEFEDFEAIKLSAIGGKLKATQEDESYYFSLIIPA